MGGEANGTADPSCDASEPPYSQELLQSLDLPGRFLFAILTVMMLIANLVFIEEAVYIYRKIPSSKRSIIIWINAAAPVIATTSCTGMWIPRSTMFTDFTAAVFFAIVIHKFLMMMIKECGGQKLLLRRFENDHFKISTGPCCCCCLCLPRVRITRRTLFWLKLGTFQFVFLRPMFMFLSIVLWTNGNYTLYNLSPKGAAIWISCFVGVLTIIALWPVGIMFQQVRTLLICKKIIPKFALYQFILILNHLQAAIINLLAMQRIIPCAPPLSSSARGAYMTQQLLIIEMFLITLISRVVYRRRYDDLEPPDCMAEEAGEKQQTPKTVLNGTVSEDGLPRV
ncbi:organic solute transporter subunit alpha-like isoform X1 [Falco rusticolus]|uniref:organic solute transporter subunit alpha-like isoform X1 n=1 Tax=Falco rusticolus TaxID=120794 RepID=UPI0018867F5B|nr:organic solute transporter subunit alpha-like isoform X1 [Falco rusticolus]XP_055558915.1 organic solute transporter subunit alpha-like isoform X1 [Falco cherrug]